MNYHRCFDVMMMCCGMRWVYGWTCLWLWLTMKWKSKWVFFHSFKRTALCHSSSSWKNQMSLKLINLFFFRFLIKKHFISWNYYYDHLSISITNTCQCGIWSHGISQCFTSLISNTIIHQKLESFFLFSMNTKTNIQMSKRWINPQCWCEHKCTWITYVVTAKK